MELFQNFAGHAPQIEPLLEKRGLSAQGGDGATPEAPQSKP